VSDIGHLMFVDEQLLIYIDHQPYN